MEGAGLSHWADILIVLVYFAIVLGVGLWTLCRPKRGNVKSYFLAGRSMPWFAIGASLFSSNIGSEHFVGLAGAGAAAGIAMVLYEWFPIFLILMLGWLFIPVYVSAGVYTLPEYIERRHGGRRIRMYLSCLALVLYVITKMAAAMFSGALFIQLALKWDMYLSLAVLLSVTGLYTVLGGLTAVMYTDTFQTAVMIIGSSVVMVAGFVKIGSYENMLTMYPHAIPSVRANNTTCGLPREDAFHVFHHPVTGDQPWPGLVLQSSLGCLWYWCCDQVIVQRSLAARNLTQAKGGSILAGILKITPLFLLIFPGMISRILFTDEVACADPEACMKACDNPVGCSNIAYPKLVLELLPVGARGLLLAVMLSAIMSSLTSVFNSASTVFTMDLWRRIRPSARQRELLIVGRIFVVIMCVVAILWVPMVKASQGGRLFTYMVAVEGYVGSPLGVLFLLSIFWKRTTETGAFFGIMLGHLCGVARFVAELVYPAPPCGEPETRPAFLYKVHYTYFVQLQLLFTAMCIVVISLLTKPRPEDQLTGVTWWTRYRAINSNSNIEKSSENHETVNNGITNETVKISNDVDTEHGDVLLISESPPEEAAEPVSRYKHWCNVVCGMDDTDVSATKAAFDVTQIRHFLKQSDRSSKILNVCAIGLIIIVTFITGFYH